MLISILLHFGLLLSSPCTLSYGNFGFAHELTTCLGDLNNIVNPPELVNFVDTVIKYLENSPYPLLYLSGPNGRPAFNIFQQLEDHKELAATWVSTGKTVLQFYQRIQEILVQLRDPHVQIVYPFLMPCAYALPYGFAPVPGNEDSLKLVPNFLTKTYINLTSSVDYTDFIISNIRFNSTDGMKTATQAVSDFAAEVSNADDNPHGQFNSIIKSGNFFPALDLISPEVKYGDVNTVRLRGKINSGGTNVVINIPWLGLISSSVSELNSFAEVSPLAVPSTKGSRLNNAAHGKKKISELLRDMRKKDDIPPVEKEKIKLLKKLKEEYGDAPTDPILSPVGDTDNFKEIYRNENDYGICVIYVDTPNKIGYIRHTAYMQNPDDPESFTHEFAAKYKEMVNAGVKDIIYDVRGNRGGMVYTVSKMSEFFFHSTLHPADPEYDALYSGYNQLMSMAGDALGEEFIDKTTYKIVDGAKEYFYPVMTSRELANNTGPPPKFQQKFTERSYLGYPTEDTIIEAYDGFSPFDPQHFYIVTDAECASGCGVMTRTAVEAKSARVLGYGKNPTINAANVLEKYYPGNCPGTLLNTESVEGLREQVEAAGIVAVAGISAKYPEISTEEDLLDLLPPAPARLGVQLGVTQHEFFSPNPNHRDETLFFVQARVAAVLPIQVTSEEETVDTLKEIATTIKSTYIDHPDFCFADEVKGDDTCSAPFASVHQVWGKACLGTSFTGTCTFAHCEYGYYLASSNPPTCKEFLYNKPSGPADTDRGAVVSMPSSVCLLLMVVLTAFVGMLV